jgi:hypothetical protein
MVGRRSGVARKRKTLDVAVFDRIADDLRLPSLLHDPPRVDGFAYRFKLVLPMLAADGTEVFTDRHLVTLFELFDRRCGGSLASTSVATPSWYGSYRPDAEAEPVKDYHCIVYVYTRQIDAADRFFRLLKTVLKTAGHQPQDEILIERSPVWLVEGE